MGVPGFPQLRRHISALTRKPATKATHRIPHVSDLIYQAMRKGVKITAPRGAEGPPSVSQSMVAKMPGSKVKANRAMKTLMRRPK
jgi:hypothetical protein